MTVWEAAGETNIVLDDGQVGVQAGFVHDVNVYMASAADSAPKKFRTAVSYLDGRMPDRARELIKEAVAEKYVSTKVCFYWLLALTSGRTRRELPPDDAALLRDLPSSVRPQGDDEWAVAFRVARRLIEESTNTVDPEFLIKEFDKLDDPQCGLILRHLGLFLDGPIEDHLWKRRRTQAAREHMARGRADRLWKFFEPTPVRPRPWEPRPVDISNGRWFQMAAAGAILLAAIGHVCFLLAQAGRTLDLTVYLLGIASGCAGIHAGIQWHARLDLTDRGRAHQRPSRSDTSASAGNSPGKIGRRLDYYFHKYGPKDANQPFWLDDTVWIRKRLGIVVPQRYPWIPVQEIAYLLRHLTHQTRNRWQNGTLRERQDEFPVSLFSKAAVLFGLVTFFLAGTWGVGSALLASPGAAVGSVFLALVAVGPAVATWKHISCERFRFAVEQTECRQLNDGCQEAYEKWLARLADRPDDTEVAVWLDCDRTVLLDESLRYYRLAMSDVIAYGFIETPAPSAKRARVRKGPWRYSGYRVLLFLLTRHGVRQVAARLDFEKGVLHDRQRTNYRFNAVGSVRVVQKDGGERTFELTLVNGQSIKVQLTGQRIEDSWESQYLAERWNGDPEEADMVAETTLGASGIHHTLHILEGVAADGKEWVDLSSRKIGDHTRKLAPTA